MNQVDGKGEIEDKFRAGYQQQNEYGTVRGQQCTGVNKECSLPGQTVQYPNKPQGPAHSGIATQRLPAKE